MLIMSGFYAIGKIVTLIFLVLVVIICLFLPFVHWLLWKLGTGRGNLNI